MGSGAFHSRQRLIFVTAFRTISGAVLLLACGSLFAQSPNPEGIEFFEKNVRPLLAARCYGCHSSKLDKPMGGLLLDSRAGMLRGGKSGVPVVVAGKPDDSLFISAVRRTNKDLQMPPGKALEPNEVESLVAWVKMGAPDPRKDAVAAAVLPAPSYDWEKARQARRHWAFRLLEDPKPPKATTAEWNKSPIDQFIKAKLDEKKLTPQPRATKLALIRRVTYDLIGLPPSPEEIDAFLKDATPGSFERVVDRLLASQQYGERWGRHWLDVVRYADTAGDNADFPVPAMYRYRNLVIAAFNSDKPFDQFLRDQLAGDVLASKDDLVTKDKEAWQQKIIATGYLANARRFGSRAAEMHLTIDDTIDNLGKGMLGLSIGCARCHDHKFDPIPTTDYYALYGIFKSTNYPHPGTEIYPHTYGFAALSPDQAGSLKSFEKDLSGLDNRIEDMKAGRVKIAADDEKKKAELENQDKLRRLSARYPNIQKAYAVTEGTPANARVFIKGEPKTLGPEVPRGFLTIKGQWAAGVGRMDHRSEKSADRACDRESRMAVEFWTWHRGHAGRLWSAR